MNTGEYKMITMERDVLSLENGATVVDFSVSALLKRHDRVVIDLYRLDGSRHPEDHLGWWLFHFSRNLSGKLVIDFNSIGKDSIRISLASGDIRGADDCWFNESYRFAPVQDLHLIIRNRQNKLIQKKTFQLINAAPKILKKFYDNLHATDGYKTTGNTFLVTLHLFKLKILDRLYSQYIPTGSTVLDVGCGNSLFTETRPSWDFSLYCCDLGEPVIRERTKLYPFYRWLVSDVSSVPFKGNTFDALFAGEIIEHMPSVEETLQEWHRLLKEGGILILTTPNRHRLRNRVNHSQRPLGPDHLNELSYNELTEQLEKAGFELLERQGFYLELFLNWWRRGAKVDTLQASGNLEKNIPWINFLNKLGQYLPHLAFGLIFVARKK